MQEDCSLNETLESGDFTLSVRAQNLPRGPKEASGITGSEGGGWWWLAQDPCLLWAVGARGRGVLRGTETPSAGAGVAMARCRGCEGVGRGTNWKV